MSRSFAFPLPSPKSMPSSPEKHQIDLNLDGCMLGVAANVKLLLKLIQDHSDACNKNAVDHSRRSQIVTTMITIIDDIRSRIDVVPCRPVPELRR
ncbi:hypothetical protein QJS10_CPA09g00682 [Acorus calamus]|uniref:Uncharacterized protein n=1 Tax=Acorus calamus TaxID=4465 RepID=A0AAV9E3T2_ACOCL|nr:hypothetical protein QJS10_CPA09g00682 [Acorus calamus]